MSAQTERHSVTGRAVHPGLFSRAEASIWPSGSIGFCSSLHGAGQPWCPRAQLAGVTGAGSLRPHDQSLLSATPREVSCSWSSLADSGAHSASPDTRPLCGCHVGATAHSVRTVTQAGVPQILAPALFRAAVLSGPWESCLDGATGEALWARAGEARLPILVLRVSWGCWDEAGHHGGTSARLT